MTRRWARFGASWLIAATMMPASLRGQERPVIATIASDRPGLGDGAHVLARGLWQAEIGVGFDGGAGADVLSLGQGVIRYGLEAFELRVYANSFVVQRGDAPSAEGFQDFGFGLKLPLGVSEGASRKAIVAGMTLPTGADPFTADEATGFATFILERDLSATAALAFNAGYGFPVSDFGDGSLALILTPGFAVADVEGLSAYAGYAGFFSDGADRHVLEGGLAYVTEPDVQWDVNGGIDLGGSGWFIGVGMARRWR